MVVPHVKIRPKYKLLHNVLSVKIIAESSIACWANIRCFVYQCTYVVSKNNKKGRHTWNKTIWWITLANIHIKEAAQYKHRNRYNIRHPSLSLVQPRKVFLPCINRTNSKWKCCCWYNKCTWEWWILRWDNWIRTWWLTLTRTFTKHKSFWCLHKYNVQQDVIVKTTGWSVLLIHSQSEYNHHPQF